MVLNETQTGEIQDALTAAGVDGSVAQVLAALDAAGFTIADKETDEKVAITSVAATITAVTGVRGVQIAQCTVGGVLVTIPLVRDCCVPGSRAVPTGVACQPAS